MESPSIGGNVTPVIYGCVWVCSRARSRARLLDRTHHSCPTDCSPNWLSRSRVRRLTQEFCPRTPFLLCVVSITYTVVEMLIHQRTSETTQAKLHVSRYSDWMKSRLSISNRLWHQNHDKIPSQCCHLCCAACPTEIQAKRKVSKTLSELPYRISFATEAVAVVGFVVSN